MDKKKLNEVDMFKMNKGDIKEVISNSDINEITNVDIKSDIRDSNDIVIEVGDTLDRINVPIILRLKPSTITKLDEIAYKSRRSRNYVAQKLLDQILDTVKIK